MANVCRHGLALHVRQCGYFQPEHRLVADGLGCRLAAHVVHGHGLCDTLNAPIGAWCTSTGTAMPGMFDSVVNFKMLDNAGTFNQNTLQCHVGPAARGPVWADLAGKCRKGLMSAWDGPWRSAFCVFPAPLPAATNLWGQKGPKIAPAAPGLLILWGSLTAIFMSKVS